MCGGLIISGAIFALVFWGYAYGGAYIWAEAYIHSFLVMSKKSVKLDIVMLKVCADLVYTPISHCTNS